MQNITYHVAKINSIFMYIFLHVYYYLKLKQFYYCYENVYHPQSIIFFLVAGKEWTSRIMETFHAVLQWDINGKTGNAEINKTWHVMYDKWMEQDPWGILFMAKECFISFSTKRETCHEFVSRSGEHCARRSVSLPKESV